MKKSIVLIVLVVLLSISLLLVSCNNEDKTTSPNNENRPSDEIENGQPFFLFELSADGKSYGIRYLQEFSGTELVIPSEYRGLPVTSISARAFSERRNIEKIVIPDTVTFIGDYAFADCSALLEIVIPDSVTELGAGAFSKCTDLKKVQLSENVREIKKETFLECNKLREINIPDTVHTIGDKAFYACFGLVNFALPEELETIGDMAFLGCYGLTSVTLPECLSHIGVKAFGECLSLFEIYNKSTFDIVCGSDQNGHVAYYAKNVIENEEESCLKTVGDFVFYDDGENLTLIKFVGDSTEMVLPEYDGRRYDVGAFTVPLGSNVTSLVLTKSLNYASERAFEHAINLESVTFSCPGAIIDCDAFGWSGADVLQLKTIYVNTDDIKAMDWGKLVDYLNYRALFNFETVVYGEGTKIVPDNAFSGSSYLKNVILSSSIEKIGDSAFKNCRNMSITIPEDSKLVEIGESAFYNCSFETFDVPNLVTRIGKCAFESSALKSITFGENLKIIGNLAFARCSLLETAILPNSLEEIGVEAFINCYKLVDLGMGENSSLKKIGEKAFLGCPLIADFYIGKNLIEIGNMALANCQLIRSFEIHPENPVYSVYEGDLYSKDLTIFVLRAPGNFKQGVTIPAFVKRIENYAFYGCLGAKTIAFAEGSVLEEIGKYAFYYAGVETIILPPTLKVIEEGAFSYAQSLSRIYYGENPSLTTIGEGAFRDCYALSSLTIPTSVQSIGYGAFAWSYIDEVQYGDTMENWKVIARGSDWQSWIKKVVCSDGTITNK